MAINYAALGVEITTDPAALGYAPHVASGNDTAIASLLNAPRAGVTVRREFISSAEVIEAIDSRDFELAPLAAHVSWFESATQLASIRLVLVDGTNTRALGNIKRILLNADPQGSEARLDVLANRQGSRAEELFGRETVITILDVAKALGRG